MVDITEQTDLVKFNSGSRGRAPVRVWGRSPQKLNVFFHFQKVIVALKRGDVAIISGRLRGAASPRPPHLQGAKGGRPKRGV